jgi:hypothetical protein
MKNRAKCKKCLSIIESFHRTDYVTCKCNEISVYGGPDLMQCGAVDWENFVRVDDVGNEIAVKLKEMQQEYDDSKASKSDRDNLIDIVDGLVKTIEELPPQALNAPVTHYDYLSLLVLLSNLLRLDLPKN